MVHTYRCLGGIYMLDVESGSFYKIDELTESLIKKINSSGGIPHGEFLGGITDAEKDALDEIQDLVQESALFTEPLRRVQGNGVTTNIIKSMCLNVSHLCNLRCSYCFADGGSYGSKEGNMPIGVAKKAIDFLMESSGNRRILEIDFFGGEPLLNFDVVKETVAYARSLEKKSGKIFRFTITTNAALLTREIAEFLNDEMYNVVISIDGRKDVHNYVRKTASGEDSFDAAVKNALMFRELRGDKQYFIRGTFTKQNKDFSKDVLFLNDLGFDNISVEPVVLDPSHPLAITADDLFELEQEYEKLAEEYIKRRRDGKWFSLFHFNIDVNNGPCESKRLRSCGAGCEYVAVSPSGDIYPCHQFDGNGKYKLGNLDTGITEKLTRSKFERNSVIHKSECRNCWAKYHCSGGCAANSINMKGSIVEPVSEACALMKKRLECALAVYAEENL